MSTENPNRKQRVFWTPQEHIKVVEEATKLQTQSMSLSVLECIQRAQTKVLPPDRQRAIVSRAMVPTVVADIEARLEEILTRPPEERIIHADATILTEVQEIRGKMTDLEELLKQILNRMSIPKSGEEPPPVTSKKIHLNLAVVGLKKNQHQIFQDEIFKCFPNFNIKWDLWDCTTTDRYYVPTRAVKKVWLLLSATNHGQKHRIAPVVGLSGIMYPNTAEDILPMVKDYLTNYKASNV